MCEDLKRKRKREEKNSCPKHARPIVDVLSKESVCVCERERETRIGFGLRGLRKRLLLSKMRRG
jgi:hypothetical protein